MGESKYSSNKNDSQVSSGINRWFLRALMVPGYARVSFGRAPLGNGPADLLRDAIDPSEAGRGEPLGGEQVRRVGWQVERLGS